MDPLSIGILLGGGYLLKKYIDAEAEKQGLIEHNKLIESYYTNADENRVNGCFSAAIEYYSKYITEHPTNSVAYNQRAFCYDETNQPYMAIADYTRSIDLDPDNKIVWGNRGWTHYGLNDHRAALTDWLTALRLGHEEARRWIDEYLPIIPEKSNFIEYLRELKLDAPVFEKIIAINIKNFNRDIRSEHLDRGTKIVTNNDEMQAYMGIYAQNHYYKLKHCFKQFFNSIQIYDCSVVDWGCGQGFGVLTMFDFFDESDSHPDINRIVLIDPSRCSLERALAYLVISEDSVCYNHFDEFVVILRNLDCGNFSVTVGDMPDASTFIHIFSNILDVPNIDVSSIADIIRSNDGIHYLICVGPNYYNSAQGIDALFDEFGYDDVTSLYFFQGNIVEYGAPDYYRGGRQNLNISAYIRIFKVDLSNKNINFDESDFGEKDLPF